MRSLFLPAPPLLLDTLISLKIPKILFILKTKLSSYLTYGDDKRRYGDEGRNSLREMIITRPKVKPLLHVPMF